VQIFDKHGSSGESVMRSCSSSHLSDCSGGCHEQ